MSRVPAAITFDVVRGATWEDSITYLEDDGFTPFDATGFEARMQVRTLAGEYGTTTDSTLMLELTTADVLSWENDDPLTGKLLIEVVPEDHAVLNPNNARKVKYALWLELYQPAVGEEPEYVIPLAKGKITVYGRGYRASA